VNEHELESRIQRLVDGKLAPDERNALLAEIEHDPQLLEMYWDYMVLDSAFNCFSQSASSLQAEEPILSESTLEGRKKRQLRWSLLATAAVLAIAALVLRLILVADPAPVVTLRASPGSVLEVSHVAPEDKAPPPGTLIAGSRAQLKQGTVEVTFDNGVRSIVRGPADLTLHSDGKLFLQSGTAWFHVPEKAIGFQVETPEMIVTDLGTSFGVKSREGSPHEVHVFGGKVEVQTRRGGVAVTETLTAGIGARARPRSGASSEIPLAPTRLPDEPAGVPAPPPLELR
jgi:ferric-dicitrate binding protein FerR (iron transport regulator)